MAKYPYIVQTLRQRILNGDYNITSFPAEAVLATEFDVSYMTARRAVQALVQEGLIHRRPYGAVEINRDANSGGLHMQIAYLMPTFPSEQFQRWMRAISTVANEQGLLVRVVQYTHWNDPILTDTIDRFDGVFLFPTTEPIPPHVAQRLKAAQRLVALDSDLSELGIPSLRLIAPERIHALLDHLRDRGYQRIDYLNTQPVDALHAEIVEQYELWLRQHQYAGQLRNCPVSPYGSGLIQAYEVMRDLLASGSFTATALVCTPFPGALGAIRALYEAGMHVGSDVGVCAFCGEGTAAYHVPSITTLHDPDFAPYVRPCIEWMQGKREWDGPLVMLIDDIPVCCGESTNPQMAVPIKV